MQTISTSLQTDNHANTSSIFADQMLFLVPNQQCQSTEGQYSEKLTLLNCGIGSESVPMQLAQYQFPELAISSAKILIYFSNKIYNNNNDRLTAFDPGQPG